MIVLAWAHAVFAQNVAATPAPESITVSEAVVTGSRIPQPDLTSASPLTQIDGAEIRAQGVMRIEDAINQLPQAFADQSSTVNGLPGTATVNLRGLGDERTLVLIDGKRLMPGDPTSGSVAPDLNFIPDALVDRIEIITGGASAVYGSDAIAGVVNFIMKRDFSGVKMDTQLGAYTHDNGQTGIQAVLAAQGQPEPPQSITDGLTHEVTVVAGVNSPDGWGNVTVYGGYRFAQAITEAKRDFSVCTLLANGPTSFCAGSTSSPPLGRFLVLDPTTFDLVGDLTLDPTGPSGALRPFDPGRDHYNFAPYQYFDRPDERYTAGVFAHYQIRPAIEVYVDGMFMYDDTVAEVAPSGLFSGTAFNIACSNPMLSASEVRSFCTDAHVPPGGSALIVIGRRDVEAGPRQNELTHEDYRVVAGVRGAVADWNYDVSMLVSAVAIGQSDEHDISVSRAAEALNVVRDAAGNPVCVSGAVGCAPYDIFRIGGVTQAALAYIDAPASATGGTDETIVSANLNGKLDRYGVRSPWARDGVGVALGAEYRREGLSYSPDPELASGDLAGYGFASPAVSGHFDVYEVYGEGRLPLAQDRGPLLHDLTLDGAARYSLYSTAGGAATYKAGVEWGPAPDLRLRASYNHAVRAPNVVDLFTPRKLSGGLDFDPCAGANPIVDQQNPFATPANCARTGVTPAQYGHIAPSSEGYNALEGGNPNLRPESADTVSLGFVLTPRAIPRLSLAVDYFDIRVNGVIGAIAPDLVIEQCLETGNPTLCGLIHRAPGTGSLWLTDNGYVSNLGENTASLETRGVDLDLNLRQALPSWRGRNLGSASLRLIGTYLMSYSTVSEPGAAAYDCAGYYGGACGDPVPRWRHMFRATWETPWNVDVSLAWRYVSQVTVSAASSNPILAMPFDPPDFRLSARSYIDLSLTWRVNGRVELRLGARNVFDVDPPIIAADFQAGVAASSNTYPGVYDALGRWVFIGLSARL